MRYKREAVRRYQCGSADRFLAQFRRMESVNMNQNVLDDVFLLRAYGNFKGLGETNKQSYQMVDQCLNNAELSIGDYAKKDMDYTKCTAHKECQMSSQIINDEIKNIPADIVDGEFMETESDTELPGFSCDSTRCKIKTANGATFIGTDYDGIVEFRGIPYAFAPTENLRFKAPVIKYYTKGTIDGTKYSKKCATHQIEADQSEDCLTVNIAVSRKVLEENKLVPIVYIIHGGGFNHGSNQVQMTNLILEQDVMVISIAYRLGVWGFLHLPSIENGQKYQGNWGLLDMIAAMKWSQSYAPYFGGNPAEATLSACSSGGEAIWWLLTTEDAWPYFNRANIMGMGLNSVYDDSQAAVNIISFFTIF